MDNNKPIVRQIPIDKRRGELCSMCLSPTASELMIIVSNSTVYVIPIESLISRQNDHILRDDAIVINTCSLSNPTAIVWWPSLDHFNQTAIIGNDFGDICFVDIKSKRQIGSTSVHDSIKELNIIDDKSSVSLIIMCKNETQYRLVLEETRNRSLPKNKLDSQLPAHDSHYFNCFITAPEDREPIGPNNCWNFKPISMNALKESNITENEEILTTTLVYQNPLIFCLFETMSETKEKFGEIIVKLFTNKEFEYNLSTFSAKYLMPKQSSLPINDDCVLMSREFSDSRRLAKLNPLVQKFAFKESERSDEVLDSFAIVTTDCLYVCRQKQNSERMQFANIAIKCLIQQLLQKQSTAREPIDMTKLKTFLKECLYFDESIVLCLLVEEGLFHLAQYCAQLRAQNGLLIQYLLNSSHLRSKALNDNTYEIVMQSIYRDIFDETNEWTHYLNCFTSPQITYSLILRKELISKYMTFMIKLLPTLEMPFLTRLAVVFDPRRSSTQLLLNRVLTQLKQTYLNYESEDSDQQIIEKKDVLNFFIFVVLMIIRQNRSISTFEDKFVSIDPFIKQIENTNKKPLLIKKVGLSFITAGVSHSAVIRNGCLYLWGKSQFGCCGLFADDFTNIPKLIPNPKRLDLFKDVLSISVKSVSCGAQHSLVLTDFGVYAFGSSRFGQLGLGSDVVMSRNPIIISELVDKDIVCVDCGQYHSLAISNSGVLWTWGWNVFGQLGHRHIDDIHTPQVVQYFKQMKIIQAFAGFGHTIALDCDGIVYSFGNGTYGQLGLGNCDKYNFPQKPMAINISTLRAKIMKICTGSLHSLILTSDGNVYSFGRGSDGQLGHPSVKELKLPAKIAAMNEYNVIDIAAGSDYSLAMDISGNIWGFGNNTDSQIGPKKCSQNVNPLEEISKKISLKTNRKVLSFISGTKCTEELPIRIQLPKDVDSYCDSLNYSLDIHAMKTSTTFTIIDDNINALFDENSTNKDSNINTGVQFDAIDDEIIIFNCNHFYGFNEFKETIVTNFERDVEELEDKQTNSKDIEEMVKFYRDWDKELWDCMCPDPLTIITHLLLIAQAVHTNSYTRQGLGGYTSGVTVDDPRNRLRFL
ncbi:unnamed protein product [Medioppia subpectinata]|uniref:Uncharacterized protein n=1 Tax=Medioppia subpectinata TaxID=1979941 RepID=A0A7R9KQG4_9ACAR|nr:unnamed protein product [Medioppia subpectinata]CAG2106785.1 unnamed protein product [Medioppia subpectinata]